MATLSDNGLVRDATSMRQHIDSKAYRERQRKRIAMGHKPDDHEDVVGYCVLPGKLRVEHSRVYLDK